MPWQLAAHEDPARFKILVVHRAAGKTYLSANELVKQAMQQKDHDVVCAYIAPTYAQGKKICWQTFGKLLRDIPGVNINAADLKITLPGGGTIFILGADNPESLRGLHLDYVVIDEVADMPNNIWHGIVRPMLTRKKGGAIFIGTPKGHDIFYTLYSEAISKSNWSALKLNVFQTNALPKEEIEDLKTDYAGRPDDWAREYMVSFDTAVDGAFFKNQMEWLDTENRIREDVIYDPEHPVYTAWDIGLDCTSIWYAQVINNTVKVIDFDTFIGSDAVDILPVVNSKPYVYATNFLPHDSVKTNINDKYTTFEGSLKLAGLRTQVLKRITILDRIDVTRKLLTKSFFNNKKCVKEFKPASGIEVGINSLRLYRPKIDRKTQSYTDTPVHDDYSHAADAFGYLAQGILSRVSNTGIRGDGTNTPIKINNKWSRYGVKR